MIVVHIINRLLVQVLKNKTPYEALYKKEPMNRCLAFACNPYYNGDKFSQKGTHRCVPGISHSTKGLQAFEFDNKKHVYL